MRTPLRARAAALSWVLAAALHPAAAAAADEAACSVNASSYADTILNPPRGEDVDFFVTSGGIPNILFLLATSQSMLRIREDGAAATWGSFVDPIAGMVGQEYGYGCANEYANTLTFSSSCGTLAKDITPSLYAASSDWASEKEPDGVTYCPFFDKAQEKMATNRPGYDPDFYFGKAGTKQFFPKDPIFHEALARSDIGARAGALADGWSSTDTNQSAASAATFCATYANLDQSGRCTTCLAGRGYFFDGTYLPDLGPACGNTTECRTRGWGTCVKDANLVEHNVGNDNTAHCRLPNVWFTGNFLNFYPPKFIVERKVVKDILGETKLFRLAVMATASNGDGAAKVEDFNPACNKFDSRSNFFSNRNATAGKIDGLSFGGDAALAEALLDIGHYYAFNGLPWFAGTTYERSTGVGSWEERTGNQASVCFPCQRSSVIYVSDGVSVKDSNLPGVAAWLPMTEKIAGDTSASYAGMGGYNVTTIDCPDCATPAEAPDTSGDIAAGKCNGQQLSGACDDAGNPGWNYLPRTAWYLHNMDFRPDAEAQAGGKMYDKQSIDIYMIGFAVRGTAGIILQHAASNGGGTYYGSSTARQLKQAIDDAIDVVSSRSISFASASLSTLQASASQSVLVPRFIPQKRAHWDGHLYSFDLWSEFTGGCSVPINGEIDPGKYHDYDCDNKCTSVFLRDSTGAFIGEDATGAFKQTKTTSLAPCGNGSKCSKTAATCSELGTVDAVPFWDVGEMLSRTATKTGAKQWWQRKIYTVVDDKAPLKQFTSADTRVLLADDDTTVTKVLPYLNVRGNVAFCEGLATTLRAKGNYTRVNDVTGKPISEVGAANAIEDDLKLASPTYLPCARVLVQYVMGADLFGDTAGCTTGYSPSGLPKDGNVPPLIGQRYCSRATMLGDIFHSSPVEVWPPLGSDGLLCARGLHPQCLPSLFSGSIPNPQTEGKGNANAYDDYAKSSFYKHRNKFALVGGNDGMLHAVVTGVWQAGKNDPRTTADESKPPYEGYHDIGTGEEVWGFVPPDLLGKLPLYVGMQHQYFVDGTPMVRDVWIDGGKANKLGEPTDADGVRQPNEFHTVAVVGERRGGTHYFALDVTAAGSDLDAAPGFMWLYPQPDDPEQLDFGETYAEFVPSPPPIGPVRVDAGPQPCPASAQPYGTGCFEERWIVFLSGGFDPQYTRGRGVHMVQLSDGKELWDFSQPTGAASACDSSKDPRCHLNYPVAAPVGMMMWGTQENYLSSGAAAKEGYFDTATFGDLGGQLWVLRFHEPGHIGADGKVDNWFGARVFQMNRSTVDTSAGIDFCKGTQPFFHITANLPLAANGAYRVLAGTGDRFNLLDVAGGLCSPDNLRACVQKGCTVKLEDPAGTGPGAVFGIDDLLGSRSYRMAHNPSCGSFDATKYTHTGTSATGGACTTVTAKFDRLTITCPASLTCSAMDETTSKELGVKCIGGTCMPGNLADQGSTISMSPVSDSRNYYFSIRVWDPSGDRMIFSDVEGAKKYDAARLTDVASATGTKDLVDVNAHDATPNDATTPLATATDKGWMYYFNNGDPNTVDQITIDAQKFHMWRADERVASSSAVEASCTFWNTIQPVIPESAITVSTSATGDKECPALTPCKAGTKQVTYLYGASPGTGGMCLYVAGVLARSQQSMAIVPPHIGKLVAYVSSGQVSFGLTSVRIPQGGTNISLGEAQDVTSLVEWVPIDKELHDCRHFDRNSSTPPTTCK